MTIAELLARRETDWQALEELVNEFSGRSLFRRRDPDKIARLASLYRSAASDLALAESYQFPASVTDRLNDLTGRAYNCLYRRQESGRGRFVRIFLWENPRWIIADWAFWIALALFWIPNLYCRYASTYDPSFAESIVGAGELAQYRQMYENELDANFIDRLPAVLWYAQHNGGIGFKCFALGILGCAPGVFLMLYSAIQIGCVEGYMHSAAVDQTTLAHFAEFTTAHGPFELTAIVLACAAGMRIGFGLVMTRGFTRLDSMRRETIKATPMIVTAFVLFCIAGSIEALVSPSPLQFFADHFGERGPYYAKFAIACASTALLLIYFGGFGIASLRRRCSGIGLATLVKRAFAIPGAPAVAEEPAASNAENSGEGERVVASGYDRVLTGYDR